MSKSVQGSGARAFLRVFIGLFLLIILIIAPNGARVPALVGLYFLLIILVLSCTLLFPQIAESLLLLS